MYGREARKKLTADPPLGLAHFCREPPRGHFVEEPGVEVTGAGSTQVNGWYRRREVAEGPPRGRRGRLVCPASGARTGYGGRRAGRGSRRMTAATSAGAPASSSGGVSIMPESKSTT